MSDAKTTYKVAIEHMRSGRLERGWPLMESRLEIYARASYPPPHITPWRGEPLAGKRLLLWPEQGYGDRIQFARYIAEFRARGADVVVVLEPGLLRLFEGNFDARFILEENAGGVEADYALLFSSIPYRLGATLENLPNKPYIAAKPRPSAYKVGVATRGDPRHKNDHHRSLSTTDATHLRVGIGDALDLHPDVTGAKDFQDTAEIIAGLDLVISVDTSVAHLAGAMGKPVWLMLPAHNTDWRWMRERKDSPWYPSMRLFRQPKKGDWTPVIKAVGEAFQARKALQLGPLKPAAAPSLVLPPGATWTPRL